MARLVALVGSLFGVSLALAATLGGCGSSSDGGTGGHGTGGGGTGGAAGSGGSAGDAASDSSTGGQAGSDAGSDGPVSDGWVPKPVSDDIQFQAKNPMPQGEQLVFDDWNPMPNTVSSIKPDGTGETQLFQAYRVWSLGVSHDGSKIAFACGDPLQLEHYGLNLGDAIQNTWLYDVATQSANVVSWGNQNDECHTFNAKDDHLYVCRRYDFMPDNSNKGYRNGRFALTDGNIEWLEPEPASTVLDLYPQPSADESTLYFTRIEIKNGSQARSLMKQTLPTGTPELVRADASGERLSPDGTKLLFADFAQQSALYVMNLDGSNVVKVATRPGTSAVWSPDGTKIAYLWGDTQTCNNIEIVAADGSQADSPVRIRDCGASFVTDLAWVIKP